MTETTREERDEWRIQLAAHAIADDDESPDDIGFWNRAINDADRLAAIERDVRELADAIGNEIDTGLVGPEAHANDVRAGIEERLRAILDSGESDD